MEKELKFICAQPDDNYYTWQVHLWLESLKKIGHSDKAIVLIYTPAYREQNKNWKQVIDLYPEAEFNFYKDEHDLNALIGIYIPVLRPYVLWRYFKDSPKMSSYAVFYCDSDILFTEKFNVDDYINDDICYLSNTNSYINSDYFDSKINQVIPEKVEEYKTRDVLSEITSVIGITRVVAVENKEHSGGAQYLLKNVDHQFWNKVMNDCIIIRTYLQKVNREFFKTENDGFQSWCADMWSVLWNLWFRDKETQVIEEMNFAWSTDPISKLETTTILHNAGVTGTEMNGVPYFYKGKYHMGSDPTSDEHLEKVLTNDDSKKVCNWYYANALQELKNKYNLYY